MTLEQVPDYAELRNDIVEALSQGREDARKAIESVRLQTYWAVGSRLCAYLDSSDRRYGDQTLKQLAADVNIDLRLLYEIVEFRRRIENLAPGPQLSWSHYRRLIRIGDPDVRGSYLQAALENGWSVRQLEAQIADGTLAGLPEPSSLDPDEDGEAALLARRGEPWVYRLIDKPGVGRVLDLGFRVHERLTEDLDPGLPVDSLVQSKKGGGTYSIEAFDGRRHPHTYKATIASIVDADTFWITVDCGFGTLSDHKIRLRGVDSPEAKAPAGVRATDYVTRSLEQVDHVVVSTTKLDLHDRYLSDLLYLPGEKDPAQIAKHGRYLNRELIEGGFARRWAEEPKPW